MYFKWRHKSAGSALVIVLWLSMVLTLLATTLVAQLRTDLDINQQRLQQAQTRYSLEAAQQYTLFRILTRTLPPANPSAPDETPSPNTNNPTHKNQSVLQWRFNGMEMAISVAGEAGKANPNLASSQLLSRLIQSQGYDSDKSNALADAILDWRDPDDLSRLNGAEAHHYRAAGLDYEPTNTPFQHLAELQRVLGMEPQLYQQLRPYLTLHNRSPSVNLSQASDGMRQALTGSRSASATPSYGSLLNGSHFSVLSQGYKDRQLVSQLESVHKLDPNNVIQPFATLTWYLTNKATWSSNDRNTLTPH